MNHYGVIPVSESLPSPETRLRAILFTRNLNPGIETLESRIAPAAVITVNSLSNHDVLHKITLADAIHTANSALTPTVIDFAPHLTGVISLATTLDVTGAVTINGAGITLNGGGKVQDLAISGGVDVTLNGLKITGGLATTGPGGGLYINDAGGTVTLVSCVVSGNHATGAKGAAGQFGGMIPGSNGYNAVGGGIAIMAGTVNIQSSTISGNAATGGAGGAGGNYGGSAQGGGIYNAGTLTVTNSHITGNTATGGAGTAGFHGSAYYAGAGGPVAATNGGAGGSAYGGGIANVGGSVTIQNTGKSISIISGNTAKAGAGGAGGASYAGSNGVNFHVIPSGPYAGPVYATGGYQGGNGGYGGNGGAAAGGGISSTGGSVTIMKSTISGNVVTAGAGGSGANGGKGGNGGNGGILPASGGNPATTYYGYAGSYGGNGGNAGNAGLAAGGAVFSKDSLTIQASTISGNTLHAAAAGKAGLGGAAGTTGTHYMTGSGTPPMNGTPGASVTAPNSAGGGFYFNGTTLSVSISTFAKNTAQDGGGGHIASTTGATIHNSTFALNTGTLGGGGLFIASGNAGAVNVVSTIIAQNIGSNLTGTLGGSSTDNITSGTAVSTLLGLHSGGFMGTLLPIASLAKVANNGTTNPDSITTDQNGVTLGSMIEIGAVQTPV